MKKRSFLTLFLTLAAVAVVPAAAKPNFTGEWKIDAAKSDFGQMPAPAVFNRSIKHEDPNLVIDSVQAGPQGEVKSHLQYTTDGRESSNTMRGGEVKGICKWDGDTLVISYKRETPQGAISVEERWELAADGKSMTIVSKISGGFGNLETRAVFTK